MKLNASKLFSTEIKDGVCKVYGMVQHDLLHSLRLCLGLATAFLKSLKSQFTLKTTPTRQIGSIWNIFCKAKHLVEFGNGKEDGI